MSVHPIAQTLAQSSNGDTVSMLVILLIQLAIFILVVVGMWMTFSKAGQPGWAAIIPIYNVYILCKIAGRPGWWILLMFIPLVNLVVFLILSIDVARSFGQGAAFGVGLWLLGIIFYPILGLSPNIEYQGPAAA